MKSEKVKEQKNYYYSFLTVFLLFFTIYLSVVAVYNITKFVSYNKKIEAIRRFVERTSGYNYQRSYGNGLFVRRPYLWIINQSVSNHRHILSRQA